MECKSVTLMFKLDHIDKIEEIDKIFGCNVCNMTYVRKTEKGFHEMAIELTDSKIEWDTLLELRNIGLQSLFPDKFTIY